MQAGGRGLPAQAVLSMKQDKAEWLFGKLGTHARIAGATLQLKDPFENDRFGRKVVVHAASRPVATSAISALIFTLSLLSPNRASLHESEWNYLDDRGDKLGPFPYARVVKWRRKREKFFADDHMRLQHASSQCWLPAWFLEAAEEKKALDEPSGADISMEDSEQLVAELNSQRGAGGMLRVGVQGGSSHLSDFPELSKGAGVEPMDYELSPVTTSEAAEGARVFVIVDTNVLMSHMASLERTFDAYGAAATAVATATEPSKAGSSAVVEVLLMVPWIVLSELDRLKHSERRKQADSARHALHRLRALTSRRDTYVRLQPVAEHQQAVREVSMPATGAHELRNDDMILQTALFYRTTLVQGLRQVGQRSEAFLLSNDSGLAVRAQANGVHCFTARELPREPEQLAREVPRLDAAAPAATGSCLLQSAAVPPNDHRVALDAQPAVPSPAASPSAGSLQAQVSGSLPPPASPAALPSTHHQPPPHPAQLAAAARQQVQLQQQQLGEQMQRLRMAAQQAAVQQQQQQQQQRQHAVLQQQQQHQQQAVAEQEALARIAAATALSLEQLQLLAAVAPAAGITLNQLVAELVEWRQWPAGGPVSPQLEHVLLLARQLARQLEQQQAAQQAANAHAEQRFEAASQAAAAGDQQALVQLASGAQVRQLMALMQGHQLAQGQARAAAAAAAVEQGDGGGGALLRGQQSQPQRDAVSGHGSMLRGSSDNGREGQAAGMAPSQRQPAQRGQLRGHAAGQDAGERLPAQDAAMAQALAARQLVAAGIRPAELLEELCLVTEQCIAPMVQYHLQQDIGDMWLAMAEGAEAELPWDAHTTLQVIRNRRNTFNWSGVDVLEDGHMKLVHMLERFLRGGGGRGGPLELADVVSATHDMLALLEQFRRTASKPRLGCTSPDPSEVEGFVSLGQATVQVEQGIQRCARILSLLQL